MSRIFAPVLILSLLVAGPASASDPVSPPAAEQTAPTPATGSTPAPAPPVEAERAPAQAEGPDPADEAAMAGDERLQEIERLRKRRNKGWLASVILLAAGTGLVSGGAQLISGGPSGIASRTDLDVGLGLAIAGSAVAMSAIIPAVIARRARNQANRLEASMAFAPGGWIARGGAGAGFTLRF